MICRDFYNYSLENQLPLIDLGTYITLVTFRELNILLPYTYDFLNILLLLP